MIVASIFKDSDNYADRWAEQLAKFVKPRHVVAICGTDHDVNFVQGVTDRLKLPAAIKYQKPLASAHRFFRISAAWNEVLRWARVLAEPEEPIFLLESEIIFTEGEYWTLYSYFLLLLKEKGDRIFAAPMVKIVHDSLQGPPNRRALFYDTHGFKRGDQNFRNDPPFWDYLHRTDGMEDGEDYVEIHTAGSAIMALKEAFPSNVKLIAENVAFDNYVHWDESHFDPRDCVLKFPHDVRGFCVKKSKFWHPPLTLRPEGNSCPWPEGAPK